MQDFGYRSIKPAGKEIGASGRRLWQSAETAVSNYLSPAVRVIVTATLMSSSSSWRREKLELPSEPTIHEHSTLERHLCTLPVETPHPDLYRRSRSRSMADGGKIKRRFPKAEMPSFLHYIGLYVTLSALYPRIHTLCTKNLAIPLMHYETERYVDVQRPF